MIIKCEVSDIIVGDFYVAYSARSRKLSSKGSGGVIVNVKSKTDTSVTVTFFDNNVKKQTVTMLNVNTRKDCFLVPFNNDLVGQVKMEFDKYTKFTQPKLTDRMLGLETTKLTNMRVMGSGLLTYEYNTMYVISGDTDDGRCSYFCTGQLTITTPLANTVVSKDCVEAKARKELKRKILALKEGGVRLVRGKLGGENNLDSLAEARVEVMKHQKKYKKSCCVYSNVYIFGDSIKSEPMHAICHSDTSVRDFKDRRYIISGVTQDQGSNASKEASEVWLNFLANRSPVAEVFITKDVKDMIKNGAVFDCRYPSNAVQFALIATRQPWEYAARVEAFKVLKELIPERYAFLISHYASGSVKDGINWSNLSSGHSLFNGAHLDKNTIVNFVHGGFAQVNLPFNEVQSYNGVFNLFGKVNYEESWLKDELGEFKSINKSSNPFEIPKPKVEQAIEYAVATYKKLIKLIGDE